MELPDEYEYAISGEWLITRSKTGECTCNGPSAGVSAHEAYCGEDPVARIEELVESMILLQNVFHLQPLPEDVTGHTMQIPQGGQPNHEDGRLCWWHQRLNMWVTLVGGQWFRCVRDHGTGGRSGISP